MKSPMPGDLPILMGILNVTPDSFSDEGLYADPDGAVARGLEMAAEGADVVDVGGESTRPGSAPVSVEEELARVVPVVRRLAERGVVVSIDTTKPEVAAAAVAAGARMINDVSGLRRGDGLARVAAASGAALVLMHSRGTPSNMQLAVEYGDVVTEVKAELGVSLEKALGAGVSKERIWLDPGIGFAKTAAQSMALIARLEEIAALGYPVLVGPSRKSFIGAYTGAPVGERFGGTAAAIAVSVLRGALGVRVHDVAWMRQALVIAHTLRSATGERGARRDV